MVKVHKVKPDKCLNVCFVLNVAPLRETKNLCPLNDMPHCEKGKRRFHATTQRKSASDG